MLVRVVGLSAAHLSVDDVHFLGLECQNAMYSKSAAIVPDSNVEHKHSRRRRIHDES